MRLLLDGLALASDITPAWSKPRVPPSPQHWKRLAIREGCRCKACNVLLQAGLGWASRQTVALASHPPPTRQVLARIWGP